MALTCIQSFDDCPGRHQQLVQAQSLLAPLSRCCISGRWSEARRHYHQQLPKAYLQAVCLQLSDDGPKQATWLWTRALSKCNLAKQWLLQVGS